MAFDIESYLEYQGGHRVLGDNGVHICIDCPWCGKAKHLYVNIEPRGKGRLGGYKCFKCEEGGFEFVYLYAVLEGLENKEARVQLAKESIGSFNRTPRLRPAAVDVAPVVEQLTPWPSEYIPVWDGKKWNFPLYLQQRAISQKTAFKYELGYCNSGDYAGRVILPIRSPTKMSWTARTVDGKAKLRYKAGPGAGRLLFGWSQAQGATTLVVVEGPFDTLAVDQTGIRCVALMGLQLREYQIQLIRAMRCRRIVWMLDDTALSDALGQVSKLPGENVIAAPLGYKDAAKAVEEGHSEAIRMAINNAIPWQQAQLQTIISQKDEIVGRSSQYRWENKNH